MTNEVIDQLKAYLDYAAGEAADELQSLSPSSPPLITPWFRRGPIRALLAGLLVLAIGVPAILLISSQEDHPVAGLPEPLDVGVKRVWPDAGFPGGPDQIAAAFAEQAMAWTNVEVSSDPEASREGPVWTTIRQEGGSALELLSVPIGDGLRALIQVGLAGVTVSNTDNNRQQIDIPHPRGSVSAVMHIRFLGPDRVEVFPVTASDLDRGHVVVSSESPIGGIVVVYFDPSGLAITAVGLHFGPFDGSEVSTVTTSDLPESFPADRSNIGLGWEAVEIPADMVARCHRAVVPTDVEVIFWGGDQESCDYEFPTGDPGMAYDPTTGTWRRLPESPLSPVVAPTGVWTGSEIFICCGMTSKLAAAYDPSQNAWRELAESPLSGPFASAVWTGSEMVVVTQVGVASYDPSTDTWRKLPRPPEELGRTNEVVWTGSQVIVWPRMPSSDPLRRVQPGLALDPSDEMWTLLPDPPAWPSWVDLVSTGDSLIVWGGLPADTGGSERAVGSQYDLGSGIWKAMPEALPEPDGCECNLGSQTLAWTGEYLLVAPGWFSSGVDPDTPVLIAYNPDTEEWILVDEESPLGWGGITLRVGERLVMIGDRVFYVSPPNWQPTGSVITSDFWGN